MTPIPLLGIAAAVSLAGCSSLPGAGTKEAEEHSAHHSAGAVAKGDTTKFDQQIKVMQNLHQKMAAAKTPEERAALMKDHMKAMQDGMAMMGQMSGGMGMQGGGKSSMGGGMPMDQDMTKRRMDMMEVMMQMMMDREAARPPVTR